MPGVCKQSTGKPKCWPIIHVLQPTTLQTKTEQGQIKHTPASTETPDTTLSFWLSCIHSQSLQQLNLVLFSLSKQRQHLMEYFMYTGSLFWPCVSIRHINKLGLSFCLLAQLRDTFTCFIFRTIRVSCHFPNYYEYNGDVAGKGPVGLENWGKFMNSFRGRTSKQLD